jgi:hypothetical protein
MGLLDDASDLVYVTVAALLGIASTALFCVALFSM